MIHNIIRRRLPGVGQRMLKTAIAVFICLIFDYLRGYHGQNMPTEAVITAIICMQPYVRDSREYALNRFTGTLIGAFWGLLFLLLFLIPSVGNNPFLVYALMAAGVLLSLYTAVAFRKADASGLSAIVFICIVIAFPDIEDPLPSAVNQLLGVLVGTVVAVGVNVFHLPRGRNSEYAFFIHTADLVPDRFSQISPTVLFRLNELLQEGAKICLISAHAPAFFTSQVSSAPLTLPMIVMDGAAIYDAENNKYLWSEPIPACESEHVIEYLNLKGDSCFLYTIHKNKTCVFHHGNYNPQEHQVLSQMRRTPYRSYLDEENYTPEEIVSIKIIGRTSHIERVAHEMRDFIASHHLRLVVRPQVGCENVSGIYIYSEDATVANAKEHLMQTLWEEDPILQPIEFESPAGYRSEHDAISLLLRARNLYSPVQFFGRTGAQKQ